MVKVRRSLTAAMNVSPEALAFIGGGQVAPAVSVEPEPVRLETQLENPVSENATEPAALTIAPVQPTATSQGRKRGRSQRAQTSEPEVPLGMAGLLVPLTTRISPRIATSLKRAGLEQRLHGRKPATVQEIVENALESWLYEAGYIDELRPNES
jgi:hypothetical protein